MLNSGILKFKIFVALTVFSLVLLMVPGLASSATVYADDFIYPIDNWRLSSNFGGIRGEGIYHLGADAGASAGTNVLAIGNGIVRHIGIHSRFGTVILIEHILPSGEHVVSLYGHLRMWDVAVSEGDYVNKGQLIGHIGAEGEENGWWSEHIHLGIRIGPYVDVNQSWVYWGLGSAEEINSWYDPVVFIGGNSISDPDPNNRARLLTGPGEGGRAHIRMLNKTGYAFRDADIFAMGDDFYGGADVASGDINGDGEPDTIVGAGPGGSPIVKVFDKHNRNLIINFFAYDRTMTKGVRVASGDLDGDGTDEIITGAGPGGGAHVRVFNGDGSVRHGKMFPFGTETRSGVDVAAADIDGDNKAEIIVGAGPGGKPMVKVYQNEGYLDDYTIMAYGEAFRGGVRVDTGDIDADGVDEIITGAGPGGGPHVRVFEHRGAPRGIDFFPFSTSFRGGVDVTSFDYDGDGKDEVVCAQTSSGQSWVKIYRYNTEHSIYENFIVYAESFVGGANIAGIEY